jgi:hypothetical protein
MSVLQMKIRFMYSQKTKLRGLVHAAAKKAGTRPRSFISGNIYFEFSVQCLCSVSSLVCFPEGMKVSRVSGSKVYSEFRLIIQNSSLLGIF